MHFEHVSFPCLQNAIYCTYIKLQMNFSFTILQRHFRSATLTLLLESMLDILFKQTNPDFSQYCSTALEALVQSFLPFGRHAQLAMTAIAV